MSHESNAPSMGPSRRTVVKGAAWAVPAIAVASAAPAFAQASPPDTGVSIRTASMCKHPGNSTDWCKHYHMYFCFDNVGPGQATVEITSINITGESGLPMSGDPGTFTIDQGQSECVVVHMGPSLDSSNISGTINFNVAREEGVPVEDYEPITFTDAKPCPRNGGPGGEPYQDPVPCT